MEKNRKARNKPTIIYLLIFNKEAKNMSWEKSPFSKCIDNWTATCKRMKLDNFLMPYRKINPNIQDLNVKPEAIKL